MPENTFASRMKLTRKSKGVSATELAEKAGLPHPNTVYRIESGKHDPILETATKVALALDVSLDYLAGLTDGDEETQRRMAILQQIEELKAQLS